MKRTIRIITMVICLMVICVPSTSVFAAKKVDISKCSETFSIDGEAPQLKITYKGKTLKLDKNYTLKTVDENEQYITYKITGKGTYKGSKLRKYNLETGKVVKFKITYDSNGGSAAPDSQSKLGANSITLSSSTPSKTAEYFVGWLGSDGKTYNPGQTYSADSDLVLTAQYKPVDVYIIGDSRTNDMYDAVKYQKNTSSGVPHKICSLKGKSLLFYSRNGAKYPKVYKVNSNLTYTFFNDASKGTTNKDMLSNLKYMNERKGSAFVSTFGANDIHNKGISASEEVAKKYVDRVSIFAKNYPNVKFVIVGVTACGPKGTYFKEASRVAFNEQIGRSVKERGLNNLVYLNVDNEKGTINGSSKTIAAWIKAKQNLDRKQLHYNKGKMELSKLILTAILNNI